MEFYTVLPLLKSLAHFLLCTDCLVSKTRHYWTKCIWHFRISTQDS